MNPKISIIIPCYNQAQFLEECLQSVLDQSYENWECLLINDGSTDQTEEICKIWVRKDNRFSYYKRQNQGVTKTRDFGLDNAKGEWIQFLDADDILAANKLEKSLEYRGHATLVICNFGMLINSEISPPFCDLTATEINFKNLV